MPPVARAGDGEEPMDRPILRDSGPTPPLLALTAAGLVLVYLLAPSGLAARSATIQGAGAIAAAIAAVTILRAAGREGARQATRWYALALATLALLQAVFLGFSLGAP